MSSTETIFSSEKALEADPYVEDFLYMQKSFIFTIKVPFAFFKEDYVHFDLP